MFFLSLTYGRVRIFVQLVYLLNVFYIMLRIINTHLKYFGSGKSVFSKCMTGNSLHVFFTDGICLSA